MFVRSFIPIAALAALVAAAPSALRARDAAQCNTGPIQCCNKVTKESDPSAKALLGLLNVAVGNVDQLVGLHCSPIIGSAKCEQQPVCCDHNDYNGVVVIGCSPVNVL